MPRKQDPASLAGLARQYGVSPTTIRRWRDECGVDVGDQDAVGRLREALRGEDRSREPKDLTEARKIKVVEETRLLRLKIEAEERRLVPADRVEAAGVRIGVVTRQGLLRLENDLPPALEGLSAARMKKVIRGVMRNLLRELSTFSDEAFENAVEGAD